MNIILKTVLVAVILASVIFAIAESIKRQEQYECEKLAEYSKTLKDFYYTDYQLEMCNLK